VLEVSASDQNGKMLFSEIREFKNVGLSRRGEPATAAWLISSYSHEKSTAIRAFEKKKETVTIALSGKYAGKIVVRARIISHHGLPTNFGKPAEGRVVLEQSRTVILKNR
jgi:hypothetical protein